MCIEGYYFPDKMLMGLMLYVDWFDCHKYNYDATEAERGCAVKEYAILIQKERWTFCTDLWEFLKLQTEKKIGK